MSDVGEIIRKLRLLEATKAGDILPDELGGPWDYAAALSKLAGEAADALQEAFGTARKFVPFTVQWSPINDITSWVAPVAMGCFPLGTGDDAPEEMNEALATAAFETLPGDPNIPVVETEATQSESDRLWRAVCEAAQS